MNVYLMHQDRNFSINETITQDQKTLTRDLGIEGILEVMANQDPIIYDICNQALFLSLNDPDAILYRQAILKDCIKNPKIIRTMYELVTELLVKKKEWFWSFTSSYRSSNLSGSVNLLKFFIKYFICFKEIADNEASKFNSAGFKNFFAMIRENLDDDFIKMLDTNLKELQFKDGVLISAQVGKKLYGHSYVLRKKNKSSRLKWRFAPSFTLHSRDDRGAIDLGYRKVRACEPIIDPIVLSTQHVLAFWNILKSELAFYVGALNLYDRIRETPYPLTFPDPMEAAEKDLNCEGLYDLGLSLIKTAEAIISNSLSANMNDLLIVTGANQGGKTTFLRSLGQAQLMMQCGLFVPSESFTASVCSGIFSHFTKDEDATMTSGKLDEELNRMSAIIDKLTPQALILFNESFASTNEREGSEIARQIVKALLAKEIRVVFVTHFFAFANGFYQEKNPHHLFLRAERSDDGSRTFVILPGKPFPTSFGNDLYQRVFETCRNPST
ncbi:DNA mismatch repair protein MutS [Acetobacterium sp.]|uniref:MutS-related protein n=1 Tax=Acetobacterium sp. TaxID=1872094 RepID=UPI00359432C3